MKPNDLERYLGKNVVVVLKNKYQYRGPIKESREDSILINDKFGKDVIIEVSSIAVLTEILNYRGMGR